MKGWRMILRLMPLVLALLAATAGQAAVNRPAPVTVTVDEGTSIAVAVSPDGKMLAMDLQGSIWVLPATGGPAKRITDLFNDARQPVWSPDGKTIAFFAYRDGGYDLWAVAPDGTGQHQLTWGPFDDRDPIFSHDGTRIAFSSDRGSPLGSDYNIFVLDLRSGGISQLTSNPAEDMMPSWSPDDRQVAFASTRENGNGIWAVDAAGGSERRLGTSAARVDAVSWGPDGQILAHAVNGTKGWLEANGKPVTGDEHVFPFRPSFLSGGGYFYTADGKIKKRGAEGAVQTIPFTAQLEVTPVRNTYVRRKRDFDSQVPRKTLGIVHPVLSPDGKTIAFAALGDIYLMPVGGKPRNITHDAAYDTDPAWSPDGGTLVYGSDKGGLMQLWLYDVPGGRARQLTHVSTQPVAPSLLARWQAYRLSGCGRHVAARRCGGGGCGQRCDIPDSCLDLRARRADLVAGWRADRGGDGGALFDTLPRGHQPGADHVVHRHPRQQRRQMVCAGAQSFHRQPRRQRPGLVARRHADGGRL